MRSSIEVSDIRRSCIKTEPDEVPSPVSPIKTCDKSRFCSVATPTKVWVWPKKLDININSTTSLEDSLMISTKISPKESN